MGAGGGGSRIRHPQGPKGCSVGGDELLSLVSVDDRASTDVGGGNGGWGYIAGIMPRSI